MPAVSHSWVRSGSVELKRGPAWVTLAGSGSGQDQVPVWAQGLQEVISSGGTALHYRSKLTKLADAAGIAMEAFPPVAVRELKDANRGFNT